MCLSVRGEDGADLVKRPFAGISTEQFDWIMKTNIYAPFWII
jgi:hypothetical protein